MKRRNREVRESTRKKRVKHPSYLFEKKLSQITKQFSTVTQKHNQVFRDQIVKVLCHLQEMEVIPLRLHCFPWGSAMRKRKAAVRLAPQKCQLIGENAQGYEIYVQSTPNNKYSMSLILQFNRSHSKRRRMFVYEYGTTYKPGSPKHDYKNKWLASCDVIFLDRLFACVPPVKIHVLLLNLTSLYEAFLSIILDYLGDFNHVLYESSKSHS